MNENLRVFFVCVILNIYICTNFRRKDDVYCLLVGVEHLGCVSSL